MSRGEGGVVHGGGGQREVLSRGEGGVVQGGRCCPGGGRCCQEVGRRCCPGKRCCALLPPPPPPPTVGQTNACENITFARFAMQAVKTRGNVVDYSMPKIVSYRYKNNRCMCIINKFFVIVLGSFLPPNMSDNQFSNYANQSDADDSTSAKTFLSSRSHAILLFGFQD